MRIPLLVRTAAYALFIQLAFLVQSPTAYSQVLDDLRVFGYFQGRFTHASGKFNFTHDSEILDSRRTSFTLQQLNFLFGKDLTTHFSAFLNIEVTNSFSSQDKWGSMRVAEAWVRYHQSSLLNIKAGLHIPTFNNLNEIKNRTPLLPYIVRPSAYESSFSSALPNQVFIPQQAYVQVYGAIPIQGVRLDFATYVGNQEGFITNEPYVDAVAGADTSMALMVGGRLGIRYRSLKVGVSSTIDHDNMSVLLLGAVRRIRVGGDLSFTVRRFFFEGEFIALRYRTTPIQQATLDLIAVMSPEVDNNLNKLFYYALLGYRITDRLFVYAYRDYMEDQTFEALNGGFEVYSAGGGFRVADPVVIKAQAMHVETYDSTVFKMTYLFAGVSVLF